LLLLQECVRVHRRAAKAPARRATIDNRQSTTAAACHRGARRQGQAAARIADANLDRLRAAPALGLQVALLTTSGPRAAFAQQRDLKASCRADPAQSSRSDRSATPERRSR